MKRGKTINLKELFSDWRHRFFAALTFLIVGSIIIWLIQPAVQAAVTVDTSTSSAATSYSFQRKTWFDGTRHWSAFNSGTEIEFWYSTDGTTWIQNTSATLSDANLQNFSVEADSGNAFIVYQTGASCGSIFIRKASTYPAANFSWSASTQLYFGGNCSVTFNSYLYPVIKRDSDSKVRVIVSAYVDSTIVNSVATVLSTNANDISSFGSSVDIVTLNGAYESASLSNLAPGDMYAVWRIGTQIEGKKNTAGTWDTNPTPLGTGVTGFENNVQMVSNTTADEAYLTYIDSANKTQFRKYVDADNTGWTTSNDTIESYILSLTVDSTNGVLYAGSGSGGIIYRCALSTACDAATDWTTSNDTTEAYILSLTLDSTNGVLYAGTNGGGIIYRCALSTACDAAVDWTTSNDTTETDIWSLAVDNTNGVLYAGSGGGGIIFRCALSTACDANTDWTTSFDTTELIIFSLAMDSTHGVLYAGTSGGGIIYRCVTSTGCVGAADWTTSNDTIEPEIRSLMVDSTNGVLYAGSGTGGIIYRNSSGWKPPITLDSNTGNDYPTISKRTVNNDLYVLWIRANTIYYKKGVSPYASANWDTVATTLDNIGTNTWLTSAYQEGGSKIPVTWTNGTATPWNVKWGSINFNASPNAPTLSSPINGGSAASVTPALQLSATDAESDTIKYKASLYNTAAQSGGNCTGSTVETGDQSISGTGWNNGTTAYASGATATYTVQATLTRGNVYCWQVQGIDTLGSNSFGAWSTPSTFTVNYLPSTPTLQDPLNGAGWG